LHGQNGSTTKSPKKIKILNWLHSRKSSSKKNKKFKLITLTENRLINKKFNGIKPELNSDKAFKKTDIIIDFTVPDCTLEILKIASKLKKKVVIGTTGFSRTKKIKLRNIQKRYLF
jgi:4-hydroxy-tetrahydrodipicolinate reductase